MATVANQYDPNNPNGQNQGGGGTVMNSTAGGGSTAPGGSTPGGTAPGSATANAPRPAGGAPNIQQYLNANQGAGQQLAGGIQNNVQNQADQFNQNLNTAQNNFGNQYNNLNNKVGQQGQQLIQSSFQNPQALLDQYQQSQQASTNGAPAASADQYNQFQNLNTGGYNQDISNLGNQTQQTGMNLQNQLSGIQQQTGLGANELGRSQLLQNTVGQNGYSQGQQTLDNLFLQGSPGVANQLQQGLQGIGQQTASGFNNASTDAQQKLQALQGYSAADQQQIKNLFMNGQDNATGLNQMGLGQIGSQVQNEYNTLGQNAAATQDAFKSAFANNQYTPDQLEALGLKQGQQLWGLTGAQIAQNAGYQNNALQTGAAGLAQAASPEEMARYNALNQLAGGPAGTAQSSIFGSASQAGGYNPYTLTNGPQGIQNAIQANQQQIGITGVNNIIDQMRQAGYFGGMSSGGGMRSADPGAPYRVASGQALGALENASKADANGKGGADPNSYYQQVMQALEGAWGGSGLSTQSLLSGGLDKTLADYGAGTLYPAQTERVNTTTPIKGGGPMHIGTPIMSKGTMGDTELP